MTAAVVLLVGRGAGTSSTSISNAVVFPHSESGEVSANRGAHSALSRVWLRITHSAMDSAAPSGSDKCLENAAFSSSRMDASAAAGDGEADGAPAAPLACAR